MTAQALTDALRLMPDYLAQHVLLVVAALGCALAITIPAAALALRRPRLRAALIGASSVAQTIPALALMALFYPILLALSAASLALGGPRTPALGFAPALMALTLYALLPLLRGFITGLMGVDSVLSEAARAAGMTRRQRLLRIEAPLAAPVIMAGVRTAAVWTIGAATLATPVGQTSLGNYIFTGLQTQNWLFVLVGCIAAAGLALAVDALLGLIESGLAQRSGRRIAIGAMGLLLGAAATIFAAAGPSATYRIGAKNFSEQFILAEALSQRLESAGATTQRLDGLGSSIAFRALAAGEIDMYVDYAGTLWLSILGKTDAPPRAQMNAALAQELKARFGVDVAGALGFENAYALAMRADRAAALGVKTLDDLARVAPTLTLGADLEFASRPEWARLQEAYGLRFAAVKAYTPTFMYRALESGEADVISAFSSDGRLASGAFVTLADPRGAITNYDALLLLAPGRASDARLQKAIAPLIGAINLARMRRANDSVDRDADKLAPREAARRLLSELPGISPAAR